MTHELDVFGSSAAYRTYTARIIKGQTSPSMAWLSKFAGTARTQLQELLPRCNGCAVPEGSYLSPPVIILTYDLFDDIVYTCTQLGDVFTHFYPRTVGVHPAEHCSFVDNVASPKESYLIFYDVVVSLHVTHRETNKPEIFYLQASRILVYANGRLAFEP